MNIQKEKTRILKRYIKDLLGNLNAGNYESCKRIIDSIKEVEKTKNN